jgi:hypothetical protein
MAKLDNEVTVDRYRLPSDRRKIGMMQKSKTVGWAFSATLKRATSVLLARKGVRFNSKIKTATVQDEDQLIMVTYDSGSDGHYISEEDRARAGMPILWKSTK